MTEFFISFWSVVFIICVVAVLAGKKEKKYYDHGITEED